jgi:hypothetical protein
MGILYDFPLYISEQTTVDFCAFVIFNFIERTRTQNNGAPDTEPVLGIPYILVRIRIRGFIPLTNGIQLRIRLLSSVTLRMQKN